MLDLNAFYHLPPLDALLAEIAREDAGMVIVAGMEPRASIESAENGALASGKTLVYGILARQILHAHPRTRTALVSEHKETLLRLSPRERNRVKHFFPKNDETYHALVQQAARLGYPLLFTEKLTRECIAPALHAAKNGQRILTQLDTPLRGAWVARYIRDAVGDDASAQSLRWVIAVQRLRRLCDDCKQRDGEFFRAVGCPACDQRGYRGEISSFDIWRNATAEDWLSQSSALSFETYAHELAQQGFLAAADARDFEAAQLYRTIHLLTASEQDTAQATQSLRLQVTELELAKRALEQQYRASIALQEVGHKLLVLDTIQELAAYIARRAHELCGADRAALYLLRDDGSAEIAALNGWDARWLKQRVGFQELFRAQEMGAQATVFTGYPPGIPKRVADVEGAYVRAGIHVPLIAQREVLGALIFHSTIRKTFDARAVALLQALANAGAAAIQRADLIDNLRDKIEQLEAAQVGLAQKERLERELELARQVQQNMLPRIFPLLPGVAFYARNEPARQVGGDFYDVFLLAADRVGVVIADVSDKGMPAALFMALTRSLVRAEAQREASPEIVLRRVHRLLRDVAEPTQFVTLFYGVLDLTARTLTYVRAGHDYPFLVRGDTLITLDAAGTILGLLEEEELVLPEAQVRLERGDHIVLYTDGLTDAINEAQVDFGRARLKDILLSQSHAPAQMMGDALFDAVRAHQGSADAFDDMTLLIVEVK
jgi:serine phosphatase RsbU (regulator of sigma subunit)